VASIASANKITPLNPAPSSGGWRRALSRLLRKSPVGVVSFVLLALILLVTVFAHVIAPRDPQATAVAVRFVPPSTAYAFGTDNLGRDMFSRVLYGGRPILLTGFTSVLVALGIGLLIGTVSGYRGGWVDNLLMRLMDVMLSFPSILLAILIVATLGRGLSNLIIAIAFAMVPIFARLVRSVVLSLLHEEYVTAARSLGALDGHIIRQHLLPNIIAPIVVQASALLAVAISTAAALNYIGLGVDPREPDWGVMVADGQKMLYDAPHVPLYPGLAITLTVLSINFVGDMLRDLLDPKTRRSE
jgi:peptide/nickel transport system permease protein